VSETEKITEVVGSRKTGWCNNPSTENPEGSHNACNGVWNEKDGVRTLCACNCHQVAETKTKNVEVKKESKKKVKVSDRYLNCATCEKRFRRPKKPGRPPKYCPSCRS